MLIIHVLSRCLMLFNMAEKSSRKRSPIWDCFTLAEDTKFAVCNTCDKCMSRGGNSTNTSNLMNHQHRDLHKEYKDQEISQRGTNEET